MPIPTDHRPFFSVIVPTYNRLKHLVPAINSIFEQDFSNFEVIVVDDGSTDDTRKTLSAMAPDNPRLKYFFKDNEERSIARNYGIMKATGSYVSFLDSDDILYTNHLKVAHDLLTKNNLPEVGHLGYQFINESQKPTLVRNHFDESFKEQLIHENIIHGNAIFIRRDVAQEIKFIPSRAAILSEDWYVWLRLAARYPFYFDNTVTSAVVEHADRSLSNINPDKLIASTNIIVEYLKKDRPFLDAYKGKTDYHFANHYTFLTLILALTKKRRLDTLRFLVKAIGYDPAVVLRRRFLASVKHFF